MRGNPVVVTSLISAAGMEAALAAQYHADVRDLKFQGLKSLKHKLSGFGEQCEQYLKEISDKVLELGGKLEYAAGSVAEVASITDLLQRALDSEMAIVKTFNDYYLQAQEAKDADTRNLYEHWIKWHTHKHIGWLERQLAQIKQFSESAYLLEKI
jgi:bacterioferritin (cytochrome b1)